MYRTEIDESCPCGATFHAASDRAEVPEKQAAIWRKAHRSHPLKALAAAPELPPAANLAVPVRDEAGS